MCLPFGALFREIWYSDRGFSSETKEPKLHKLSVFWANCCKKHPIWSKLGAFLSKMVYWWVGNLAKNWYRDSHDFRGPVGTSTYNFGERTPPPRISVMISCYQKTNDMTISCQTHFNQEHEESSLTLIWNNQFAFPQSSKTLFDDDITTLWT